MQNVLKTAMRLHQDGDLRQAAALYQDILSQQPDHPDALHLLGLIALREHNTVHAAELIEKAIASQPDNASFHSNLAEVYRASGQHDRAIACCRAALQLRPDYSEAFNNLGIALLELRPPNLDAAAAQFREAIRVQPGFAMAHNNLGNALRLQGDAAGATNCFRNALQFAPNLCEAHTNLGQLLLEQHEPEQALAHCQQAVLLRPSFAEAQNNLGNVLRDLGRLDDAKACYSEALRLNPALAMTHSNMGQALKEEGRFDEAGACYCRALELDPNSAHIHCNLGALLEELEQYDAAMRRYELALRVEPDYAEAHCGIASVHNELGRHPAAAECLKTAIALKPELAAAHASLGALLSEEGEFAQAEASLRVALRIDPTHAGAYAQLAAQQREALPAADVDSMRSLLARPYLADGKRAALHFGLGHVFDARGDYSHAAEHLRRANALSRSVSEKRGKGYDPAEHDALITGIITAFTSKLFERSRGWGVDSARPIFIVGLPRSGTTLTEQILASHSQICGAGELRLMRQTFESIPALLGVPEPPAACLSQLDRTTVTKLAQTHLDRLGEFNAVAPRIVDKMPDNYLHLGLIALLFPQARIIHCRRDLRDTAVSCWSTHFRQIRWASDSAHIASRFHAYARIMEHWTKTLPAQILEINYEGTVANLETAARRLISFMGLEWEPACLNFHATRRPVKTASVAQVRQPLYTRSVQRWKHYEHELEALFKALPGIGLAQFE